MSAKLKSRKLWISILSMVVSISSACVGIGGDIGEIIAIICAVATALVYIITEGKIDAKGVTLSTTAISTIVAKVKAELSETKED